MAEDRAPLMWRVETVSTDGFEYGLDLITPVTLQIVHSRKPSKAYRSWVIPDPAGKQAYKRWLKAHNRQPMIVSVVELIEIIKEELK